MFILCIIFKSQKFQKFYFQRNPKTKNADEKNDYDDDNDDDADDADDDDDNGPTMKALAVDYGRLGCSNCPPLGGWIPLRCLVPRRWR